VKRDAVESPTAQAVEPSQHSEGLGTSRFQAVWRPSPRPTNANSHACLFACGRRDE
jgi:hypothetical protein